MDWVFQKRETDCGAAAVAMLCGVSLEEAMRVVYAGRKIGITISGRLLSAIRNFGGKPQADQCITRGQNETKDDLTNFETDALAKCQMLCGETESTHWAVWDSTAQVIRDPYGYWYPLRVTHYVKVDW